MLLEKKRSNLELSEFHAIAHAVPNHIRATRVPDLCPKNRSQTWRINLPAEQVTFTHLIRLVTELDNTGRGGLGLLKWKANI